MAVFQLLLLATLMVGSFADHYPVHSDYGVPEAQVNFQTSFNYEVPDVAAPVLPSFIEIESQEPSKPVYIPPTSYGIPVGPVRKEHPALVRPAPEKHISFTDSGEIDTDLFGIFNQPSIVPAQEYKPPTTKPTTTTTTTTTTTRRPTTTKPTTPAPVYYAPTTTTTTTTTTRPTTRTTTTTTPRPTTKPPQVYGPPPTPAVEYYAPPTTTTTTTTTRKPTTTTTTTTTRKPTTTTTTTTTQKPTTTTKKVEVYGPPEEKPVLPFSDYGPPKPSYPYPAAGVPDYSHHYHQPRLQYIVRKVYNPYIRLGGVNLFPVHAAKYKYFK